MPVGLQLLILLLLWMAGGDLLGGIFQTLWLQFSGVPLEEMDVTQPAYVLPATFCFQVGSLILPLLLFKRITQQPFFEFIRYKGKLSIKWIGITIGILVVGLLAMQGLSVINKGLENLIPDNPLIQYEYDVNELQNKLLIHDNWGLFIGTIALMAILPAIVEELIFRGVLMGKLMETSGGNLHFSVIVSSVIFAGLHLQPLKLLPMIFMGCCLGYLYHYTKSIKYPILLHFLVNATQIAALFFFGEVETQL
ncbi:MAG: CPBP family intramembrane metalloprotease [Flavobacteriales bacterium]|nr:CPBP family intramembrane metalloprotease [Flavobacteriales bacterium]